MTPERWSRVRDLFAAVADLPPPAAADRLDAECASDPALRAEVERLLAADLQAGRFLEDPAWEMEETDEPAGHLGPYRLEREIGRGGMGTVWLAERADGLYRKNVALKRIRAGLDGAGVLQRFHKEREILARLEHPGIARLYDAGSDEEGRPYFVLEYVEGLPITRFCDERRLSIADRLELFRQVCAAVHYAHQNLVAHRDLKPGNILVTADGRPRLLDFGIAKLLDGGGAGEDGAPPSDETRTAERAMTPDYASPEQLRGGPVTTASDIYSLGVLLYELLTGRRPYRLAGRSPQEAERIVCEEDPEPPGRIAPLARDLDRIVGKAMHKEPGRRYASADQLADDVHRHLHGLPVAAAGDGFWYRAGKLLRRHKAAAAFLVLLLVFGVGMAVLAGERTRALRRAEAEARKAREVTDFLVRLFRVADPRREGGEAVTAGEILRRGVAAVETELAGEPEPRGTLLGAIGRVYLNIGLAKDAVPVLERSLAVRRQVHGEEEHPEVATALDDLARALRDSGNYAAAEPLARQGLALRRRLLGARHPEVARSLTTLGLLLYETGDHPGAEAALREALEIRRRLARDPQVSVAESLGNLAVVVQARGDYAGAERLYREALALYRARLGPRHPSVATNLNHLAITLQRQGKPAAAEPLLREALALHRRTLGEDHPAVAASLENLAGLLVGRDDLAAAEPLIRQALALHRKRYGDRHPKVAGSLHNLATLLHAKGDLDAAERLFREALALRRELLPAGHSELASSLAGLGGVLVDRARPYEAEPLLRQAVAIHRAALPAGHWRTAATESALGACLAALGQTAEAEALLRGAHPALEKALGRDHRQTRRARQALEGLTATARSAHTHPASRSSRPG